MISLEKEAGETKVKTWETEEEEFAKLEREFNESGSSILKRELAAPKRSVTFRDLDLPTQVREDVLRLSPLLNGMLEGASEGGIPLPRIDKEIGMRIFRFLEAALYPGAKPPPLFDFAEGDDLMVFLTKNKDILMGLNFIGLLPKSFVNYKALSKIPEIYSTPYDLSLPSTPETIQHLIHDLITNPLNGNIKNITMKTVEDFETIVSMPADVINIFKPDFYADFDVMKSDKFEELATQFTAYFMDGSVTKDFSIKIDGTNLKYKMFTEFSYDTIKNLLSIYNKLPDGVFKQSLVARILKFCIKYRVDFQEEISSHLDLLKQIDGFTEEQWAEISKHIKISYRGFNIDRSGIIKELNEKGKLTQGERLYKAY